MTVISISKPQGIMPIRDKYKLPDEAATIAENVNLDSGSLVPLKGIGDPVTLPTHKQLSLTPGYNVVKGPIHDDYFDRYYYTTNIQGDRMKVLVVKPTDLIDDSGATHTASFVNTENLFDSNSLTYADVIQGDTITFDFTSVIDIDNFALGFTSAQFCPSKVRLEYSDDNISFVEAEDVVLIRSSNLQVRTVSEATPHRYWKITFTVGGGRFNRVEFYNDLSTTESTRDVYIESPDVPTMTQVPVVGIDSPTMELNNIAAELSSEEIKGGKVFAHFTGAGSGIIDLTLGSFSADDVELGAIYPVPGETDITYDGNKVGNFKLLSVSQEVIPGVDYTAFEKNYVAVYEYELFTSSSQLLTRQYVIAIEDDLGQIGPPSLPVEYNTIGSTDITLAQLSWTAPSDPNAAKIIIFRSASDGEYYKAGEVDANVTTFTDVYTEEDYRRLTAGEPLGNFGNPVDDVTNLVIMAGGSAIVSNRKKTLYISEPLKPHVMTYTRTVTGNIVGMASTGSELIVCTDQNPELITGSHPSVMTQEIIMTNQACISRESITQVKNSIIYAGTDGLVSVIGARGELITDQIISQDQWLSYNPSTMIGESHDGKYYGFTDSHTIILDLATGELKTSTMSPDSAFSDIETDSLYVRVDDIDYKAFSGNNLTQKWRSKHYRFPTPFTFNALRVTSDSYLDTEINIYINGILGCVINPTSLNSRRLPRMPQAREMFFEVIGTDNVNSIEIATSMEELRG